MTRADPTRLTRLLYWRRTPDGRREIVDRGERTGWQIVDRYGGARVGAHYGLAPPIADGDPSYSTPLEACAALAAHLSATEAREDPRCPTS